MNSRTLNAECYLCGRQGYTHEHHLMDGWGFRKLADEDGLTIRLCPACHHRVHHDAELRRELKALAQTRYLADHSWTEWMERYGKNYLI